MKHLFFKFTKNLLIEEKYFWPLVSDGLHFLQMCFYVGRSIFLYLCKEFRS